jgi:hypothetical protein
LEIYEALTAYLLTQTGLTALIANRIYPDEAPEGETLPYVVYINISDVKDHLFTGQQTLERPVYQYTVYAADKDAASDVAEQIKAALSEYSGTMSGITVQYIGLMNELASRDRELKIYYHDLEYEVFFIKS